MPSWSQCATKLPLLTISIKHDPLPARSMSLDSCKGFEDWAWLSLWKNCRKIQWTRERVMRNMIIQMPGYQLMCDARSQFVHLHQKFRLYTFPNAIYAGTMQNRNLKKQENTLHCTCFQCKDHKYDPSRFECLNLDNQRVINAPSKLSRFPRAERFPASFPE